MPNAAMPNAAVLIDIDGTLVDSNYLHLHAWSTAFHDADHPVDARAIHQALGMDADLLITRLLGDAAEDSALVERLHKIHADEYAALAGRLRAFDGAQDLLTAIRDRGLTAVIATSAKPEELERLSGVLALDGYPLVNGEDVEEAKPEPDLVRAALEKAGVPAERAVFLGDTVWDVQAAGKLGVPCIGVLTGGISLCELMGAGAQAVYPDVRALLADLDASPIGALLRA